MLTEIPEVKYIHDTRSHNSGNIHAENLHILAIEREKSFLENWNVFSQKTAPQLLGHIELQNMKVGVKRVLSYWRPLLVGLRENTDTLRCLILCDDFLQIHFIRNHVSYSIKWRSFYCTCFLRLTRGNNSLIDLLLCSVWLCFF